MLFRYIGKSLPNKNKNKIKMPCRKVKKCGHKYDCGCKKKICERCREIIAEENIPKEDWKDLDCDDEDCKCYYHNRNDNCNCGSRDCDYCQERYN
jgi:hypothetical protein